MTDLRNAAQQALEALKDAVDHLPKPNSTECGHAITALRDALVEQTVEEVWDTIPDEFNAWWDSDIDTSHNPFRDGSHAHWALEGWKAAMKQRTEPVQEPEDIRAAFEAWMKSDSTLPITTDEHGYTDFTTALLWHAWQAAKTNAPEGASGGESCANARLGLAVADDTCAHDFGVAPNSGISICSKCGLSEIAARKRTEPVQKPVLYLVEYENGEKEVRFQSNGWGGKVTPLYTRPAPQPVELTDGDIDGVALAMPGGLDGFLKGWGWRQFARAVIAAYQAKQEGKV